MSKTQFHLPSSLLSVFLSLTVRKCFKILMPLSFKMEKIDILDKILSPCDIRNSHLYDSDPLNNKPDL